MHQEELRNLIVGPAVAVPAPFDEDSEVDCGTLHELTQWWVESGLTRGNGIIKVAAAAGEGPMLDDTEWPALLRTAVRAANDRATIVCGLNYKDTKGVIEDARKAQALGAVGLQVCPPIFNLPSQNDLLDHFGALSDAIDIGIMVYHTHWMRGGAIDIDTFLKMADFEQVVAIKWSPHQGQVYEDMARLVDRFNIIDNTLSPIRCVRLGGHGFVQTTIAAYPPHDLKVWELIRARQYDEAEELYCRVQKPLREFYNRISARSGGQARDTKALMALMGRPVGSSRAPSKPLNEEELADLRAIVSSFGWPMPE